jgi:hypothetical protein
VGGRRPPLFIQGGYTRKKKARAAPQFFFFKLRLSANRNREGGTTPPSHRTGGKENISRGDPSRRWVEPKRLSDGHFFFFFFSPPPHTHTRPKDTRGALPAIEGRVGWGFKVVGWWEGYSGIQSIRKKAPRWGPEKKEPHTRPILEEINPKTRVCPLFPSRRTRATSSSFFIIRIYIYTIKIYTAHLYVTCNSCSSCRK